LPTRADLARALGIVREAVTLLEDALRTLDGMGGVPQRERGE
jgi:hypothetical protein